MDASSNPDRQIYPAHWSVSAVFCHHERTAALTTPHPKCRQSDIGQILSYNLRLLISFTRDPDVSNRDWATMTLAMQEIDTPEVRDALLAAAEDSDTVVRAEALEGLARRDKGLALALVEQELQRDECALGTFQAARLLAHPSLLRGLRGWVDRGGASWIEAAINDAITACEAAVTRSA